MKNSAPSRRRPVILYLVTEDWFFVLHRLPIARAAAEAGYEVHLATNVDKDRRLIEELGFELHDLNWRRGSLNPIENVAMVLEVRRLYERLKPDVVHAIALQPVVLGALASTGLPLVQINSLVGLGFAFTSRQLKARMVQSIIKRMLPRLMNRPHTMVTVENKDDQAALVALGIKPEQILILAGSGIDVDRLTPLPEPQGPITAAYVGRLIGDKGIRTLLAAHNLLARRGTPIRLLIAGEPDPANPTSIPLDEVQSWRRLPGVTVLGRVSDIRSVWQSAQIAVLPSRREGLPMSLVEAAACGRPLVATDVPGCREIARPAVNALLVRPEDPSALADAIGLLADDRELRRRFGDASRRIVESEYSTDLVNRQILRLYDRLSGRNAAAETAPIAANPSTLLS